MSAEHAHDICIAFRSASADVFTHWDL